MLDTTGTLTARAPQRAHSEPLMRRARWVATVIGISLSIPMQVADGGSIDAIQPKAYIRAHYSSKEALCLIKLYGKESAFNTLAIGNLDGSKQTYGIPQKAHTSSLCLRYVARWREQYLPNICAPESALPLDCTGLPHQQLSLTTLPYTTIDPHSNRHIATNHLR